MNNTTATDVKRVLEALRREVNTLRQYRDHEELTQIEERNGVYMFDVRYLGNWEVPADVEDDGDYDWMVPTAATVKNLDKLVEKYHSAHVQINWVSQGEKCWLTFTARSK